MKKFYLFVAAALALGSCSSDEFLGENLPVTSGNEGAITFSGFKPNMHRATQAGQTAATTLDSKFEVYGVKKTDNYVNVFAHTSATTLTDAQTYDVWWNNAAGTTNSNTKGWEYVGISGITLPGTSTTPIINGAQEIKYWDYAAGQYEFVAYSKSTSTTPDVTNVTKDGFHVRGTAAELADLYIADKEVVLKGTAYENAVTFTFRNAGAKVRLGIYETVPGYDVKSITFRSANAATVPAGHAVLDGKFVGNTENEFDADVTFEAFDVNTPDKDLKAIVSVAALANASFFDFGTFTIENEKMGETSTAPSWTNVNYTEVLPNTVNNGPMTLYVDYVLENKTTLETITVKGAKAIVPKEYMSWKPNHAYTYLFKITDETNGSTGTEGTDPAGLYPITFDACVETTVDDETLGTTTTVADYSITTYQDGSVVATGVEYKANKAIDIVVKKVEDGSLLGLSDANFGIYSGVGANVTEADLDTSAGLGTAAKLTSGVNISGTKATFTPAVGRYAVKVTEGGKTYWKIIEVVS